MERINNNAIFVCMKLPLRFFPILFALTLLSQVAYGQLFDESTRLKYDTSYIKVYKDELTSRIYLSRKQNGVSISEKLLNPDLRYKTNDNLLIGLGYTYSFLNINLAVKMPFVNDDNEQYGESKYLDLSIQTNFRAYMIDLYLQWNRGYYLSNPQDFQAMSLHGAPVPLRGDMRTTLIGTKVQYLFNSRRYSYKASFLQNEFQKRSAGTPIVGVEAYWMLCMADTALSPFTNLGYTYVSQEAYNQMDLYSIGVNGGYAYTFVWNEILYISMASTIGLGGGYHMVHNTWDYNTISDGIRFGVTNNTKISVGFNSHKYFVGLSYERAAVGQLMGPNKDWVVYWTGNIRFNVVKRFNLKRTIKILRPDLWIL